jgi:hypothetical protein
VRGDVAHALQGTEPQALARVDATQRQVVDVQDLLWRQYVQLHEVDEGRAARQERARRGDRVLDCGGSGQLKLSHLPALPG